MGIRSGGSVLKIAESKSSLDVARLIEEGFDIVVFEFQSDGKSCCHVCVDAYNFDSRLVRRIPGYLKCERVNSFDKIARFLMRIGKEKVLKSLEKLDQQGKT